MQITNKKNVATEGISSTTPRLVRNVAPNDHLRTLDIIFGRASNITIAVAFLKSKGLNKIVPTLTRRLNAGAQVEMFVGTDFCQTEPKALEKLLILSKRHPMLTFWIAKPTRARRFIRRPTLAWRGRLPAS